MIDKGRLIECLQTEIQQKITALSESFENLTQSKANETKSSAGDKYETSREMMQFELDKISSQLHNLQQQLHMLNSINPGHSSEKIGQGSLVQTQSNWYFIAIPFGKTEIDDSYIYVISQASPLGKLFLNKKAGDGFAFNGTTHQIEKAL